MRFGLTTKYAFMPPPTKVGVKYKEIHRHKIVKTYNRWTQTSGYRYD